MRQMMSEMPDADGGSPAAPDAPAEKEVTYLDEAGQPKAQAAPVGHAMRAKVRCSLVTKGDGYEQLTFNAVAANSYPADGSDEDNTYAKFSPSATFTITVANPALHGKFSVGEKYYVDFVPAD